jgi:hypothetical protein
MNADAWDRLTRPAFLDPIKPGMTALPAARSRKAMPPRRFPTKCFVPDTIIGGR